MSCGLSQSGNLGEEKFPLEPVQLKRYYPLAIFVPFFVCVDLESTSAISNYVLVCTVLGNPRREFPLSKLRYHSNVLIERWKPLSDGLIRRSQ